MAKEHCCLQMAKAVEYRCEQHPNPFDCPDSLIYYSKVRHEYGIIVHDGGTSCVSIPFCPWCGTRLSTLELDPS